MNAPNATENANGRVVSVLAKTGDVVTAGQPLVVIEAMKMQHVHGAHLAGTIEKLDVMEGEQVTTGLVIAEIRAAGPDAG